MEKTFEDRIFDSIVSQLLLTRVDQYGNKIRNPIESAMTDWADKNRNKIAEEVLKQVTIEKMAQEISQRIVDVLKESFTDCWNKDKFNEELRTATIKEMACKIAKEKMNAKNLFE